MSFESFIALRYLFTLRRQNFISVISIFAVFGVALGVASLIVVIGVMSGFSHDLREKILGVSAHIVVSPVVGGINNHEELSDQAMTVDGVAGVTPFVYSEVMLSSPGGVKGLVLRGIDPDSASNVLSLKKDMVSGSVSNLTSPLGKPGLIIGADLANRLGLTQGSEVFLLSPSGTQTATGFSPKMTPYVIVGVFRTGMYEYDSTLGYVTLDSARELLGYPDNIVTGLEVSVTDLFDVERITSDLRTAMADSPVMIQHWQEMYVNLFSAMKLEKTAMFIILTMIVLVGSFSIVTTLVMLVIQKTKDIAILVSMGATARNIRNIFMIQGTLIGAVGTIIGFGLGIPLSLLLKKYQFIKLPDVYPVDYLPVRLDVLDLSAIGGAAFLLCFFATLYPAKRAAGLRPSDALRYE